MLMPWLRRQVPMQLFVIYVRYLIGGTFVFASLIKIKGHRFTSADGSGAAVHSAAHFFETLYQSGLYWQFIGVSQLVAGLLVLSQRGARLGTVVFLPIIANIFLITISYDFGYTPVVTGLLLLANLLLLWWEWPALRVVVHQPALTLATSALYRDRVWEVTGLALFAFTFGYRVVHDQYNLLFWLGGCLVLGVAGLTVGLLRECKRAQLFEAIA